MTKKTKKPADRGAKARQARRPKIAVKVTKHKHPRGERRYGDPHPRPEGWLPSKGYQSHQPARMPNEIKVGKRHRKDLGDLKALAADINVRGLLHPIVIDPDCNLIAGARRLGAWKLSKFKGEAIPVHVVPLADILAGEWAENDPALRKDFKLTEAVAIRKAIEAKLKPEARARQAQAGGDHRGGGGKIAGEKINVAERASQFTGKSRRTLDKAEAVDDAAKRDPKRFGKLKDDMDRTGRADAPYKRLQNMLQADAMREAPAPMPGNGPYVAGMIDIAWAGEPDDDDPDRRARGYYPYPTMTTVQAVAFMKEKVEPILAPACTIGFWITNYHLEFAHHLPVLAALGMKPRAIITATKNLIGRGQVSRGTTEHLIIASRGDVTILTFPRTDFPFKVDKKNHSRKDQFFYDLFVKHVPASRYFSLFETVKRGDKWDCHGDKMPAPPAPIAGKVFGGDVGPKAIAILAAKATGGVIPFNKDGMAVLNWRQNGSFDFKMGDRTKLRGAINLHVTASGVEVTAYTDDREIGYLGSTMPYKKVQRLLVAWGKVQSKFVAAIVLPAAPAKPDDMKPGEARVYDDAGAIVTIAGGQSLRDLALGDQLAVLEAAAAGAIGPPLRITKAGRDKLHQLREEHRHDEELAALPEDIEALHPLYQDALRQLHGVMIDGQGDATRRMSIAHYSKRLDLIQERANGGKSFGMADVKSPAEKLRVAAAAPIGVEPMWGQRGIFAIDVDGVPCIIEADESISISAHACDPDKPFCSETGYMSLAPMLDLAGACEDDAAPAAETIGAFAARLIRDATAFKTNPKSGKKEPRKAAPLNPEKCYWLPKSWKERAPVEVSDKAARAVLKKLAPAPAIAWGIIHDRLR